MYHLRTTVNFVDENYDRFVNQVLFKKEDEKYLHFRQQIKFWLKFQEEMNLIQIQ